jgi:lipoyl(octanoyl) transferase
MMGERRVTNGRALVKAAVPRFNRAMPQTAVKAPLAAVEWSTSVEPVAYADAVARMETWVDAIVRGQGPERVWLLEHPPIYTAGTSAKLGDLLDARFPVFKTGRGGEYTYHGPGQRVAYVMLDLKRRRPDVRVYVRDLEEWIIATLTQFGVKGERRKDRVGIWVARGNGREDKIAAIGVRVRRWVTFHGIALNVNPDLSHFTGIVPCGVRSGGKFGVTSLADMGVRTSMADVDAALKAAFHEVFEK